jgi:DUF971 family protein
MVRFDSCRPGCRVVIYTYAKRIVHSTSPRGPEPTGFAGIGKLVSIGRRAEIGVRGGIGRMAAPTELRVSKDRRLLAVRYGDGPASELPAEFLRVLSPSAEVQGHSPQQRVTVPGKRNVAILRIEPVGNYAVRIVFDDMHDTGIYSWDYLRTLGQEKEERWQEYLDELAGKNLSRDPIR